MLQHHCVVNWMNIIFRQIEWENRATNARHDIMFRNTNRHSRTWIQRTNHVSINFSLHQRGLKFNLGIIFRDLHFVDSKSRLSAKLRRRAIRPKKRCFGFFLCNNRIFFFEWIFFVFRKRNSHVTTHNTRRARIHQKIRIYGIIGVNSAIVFVGGNTHRCDKYGHQNHGNGEKKFFHKNWILSKK